MNIELDHLIIPAHDQALAAKQLASLLGVPWGKSKIGPFTAVYVNGSLTLDFDQHDQPFPMQHYCFRVDEHTFDQILACIHHQQIPYRSTPHGTNDYQVNTQHGGRMMYWDIPEGHVWEMLTQSYARQDP